MRLATNKRDLNEVVIIKENYAIIQKKNEDYQRAYDFYIDENEKLERHRFRKYNYDGHGYELSCYPEIIKEYQVVSDSFANDYLMYKLGYINQYLIFNKINKTL